MLYLVGQAKGGVWCSPAPSKTVKTDMKATPLKPNPPLQSSKSKAFCLRNSRIKARFRDTKLPEEKKNFCNFKLQSWLANIASQDAHSLGGFKKALLQNPREMIRGRPFSEMIRIRARKSELQGESRSYRPKVRVTAGQTGRVRTESLRQGPGMGFRCFYRKPPLKPS